VQLEKIIHALLKSEPYFAHFILNSTIEYNTRNVPTAGAAVINGVPVLVFNTAFMDLYDQATQVAILKHEVLHLLMDHIDHDYYDKLNKQVWNIAMDCAINQYIPNLPPEGVTVDQLSKLVKRPLLTFESAVYYYNELYQVAEKVPMPMDDHSLQDGQSAEDKQMAKGIVGKASEAALKASAGQVPEGLQSVLNELRERPRVNWKQELRNFVASAISSSTKATRTKSNRRFELEQPGKRKERKLKLAVCVDSSGSVSTEQFTAFIQEIIHISKNCAEANLIYADCEVQKVINLKQGNEPPFERYGNGGTAYQPALTKALELGCNAIAYFGDGDTADIPNNPGKPLLWVLVGDNPAPAPFGRVLRLKV
jgi:predicted metal-dependent peptidase